MTEFLTYVYFIGLALHVACVVAFPSRRSFFSDLVMTAIAFLWPVSMVVAVVVWKRSRDAEITGRR